MDVIELKGLRKEYGRRGKRRVVAVDCVDLTVPEGGVFGIIGPNASGKSTTIRCVLGLARPTAGSCRILGADPRTDLPRVIRQVGAMVEAPALFPGFTGRRNLELLAGHYELGRQQVARTLETVGLADRADDLVRTYSFGMVQRLGIATALLKEPRLLIIDEPANGLDPAGIKEMRDLIRKLGDEGTTVVISSHLLPELEHVCDRVAVMAKGRVVVSGTLADLLAGRASLEDVFLELTSGLGLNR